MKWSRYLVKILLVLSVALTPAVAFAGTLYIGCASPFTGALAPYGENVKRGVSMMVDKVNAAGGIHGDMVEVIYADDQCSAKDAVTASNSIVRDERIVGVIGHLCSDAHLAALPAYTRSGVPIITPTATHVDISNQNMDSQGRVWSFRNVYRDDFQGRYLAEYALRKLGIKRVAVFYEENDYGVGLKNAFIESAHSLGIFVVAEIGYKKSTFDFTEHLKRLERVSPGGIFISGYYNAGARIARQAAEVGLDVLKFGADGFDNEDYVYLAGDAANGTYLTVPFLAAQAGEHAQKFLLEFRERYGRDADYMSANAYDAAGILLQAIQAVGADRQKVRGYIAAMDTRENGYSGVTGLTYFDRHGDAQKPVFVMMVKSGRFVPAEQLRD